jgi:hypothetical protein
MRCLHLDSDFFIVNDNVAAVDFLNRQAVLGTGFAADCLPPDVNAQANYSALGLAHKPGKVTKRLFRPEFDLQDPKNQKPKNPTV